MHRYIIFLCLMVLAVLAHLTVSSPLQWHEKLAIIFGSEPVDFEAVRFFYTSLPRVALAILAGATLALTGSILQQITRNNLVSPFTLGISSGAWLALLVATVWLPTIAVAHAEWVCFAGSAFALILVYLIAGKGGIGGVPAVLAGMAVNMLFAALGTVITLFKGEWVRGVFIWGSGDLAQTDWSKLEWLTPKILLALPIILLAAKPLALLRIGHDGATARGLATGPVILGLVVVSLWMTANIVSVVGIIGFIGLLGPNLARLAGARKAGDELILSTVIGTVILVATDALALFAGQWMQDMVPSGASAALIGAPSLVWLSARRSRPIHEARLTFPSGTTSIKPSSMTMMLVAMLGLGVLSMVFGISASGWRIGWPNELLLSLRWPRIAAAAGTGANLALAGVILQRLIRNPLASPDILGVTSGASLALIGVALIGGHSIYEVGVPVAMAGSFCVLMALIMLGRRHDYSPGIMTLIGISLAALLDALTQFILARGGPEAFAVLGWLAGSTYRVTPAQALLATGTAVAALLLALVGRRWLTLIQSGDVIAAELGLPVKHARHLLLIFAAMITAFVTSIVGPVAFVGLLAPHMATAMGARTTSQHILCAGMLGASIMVLADWIGRSVLYPLQMPAGSVASIVGGFYFILILARRGKASSWQR